MVVCTIRNRRILRGPESKLHIILRGVAQNNGVERGFVGNCFGSSVASRLPATGPPWGADDGDCVGRGVGFWKNQAR